MTSKQQTHWEPWIFNDHGQPLYTTQEEEQQAWDDYIGLGPDDHSAWSAIQQTSEQLAHNWGVQPDDDITQATLLVRIAEQAHHIAVHKISQIARQTPRAPAGIYQELATRTGLDAHQLETTYPTTEEPPF